jgi:polysaccharide deacetylase family protein (PEP-CTERM system associated)
MPRLNCLSFDIEEHYQVAAFDSSMRRRYWDQTESRVERNTERLLELLANYKTTATFFVLGWVAERHPHLVRKIIQAGHEVASHGYEHKIISSHTEPQFREDVRKTKAILESITGEAVLGYRAPSFSIMRETVWALQILVEEGYTYDSSIFPIIHDRYGIPDALPWPHELSTRAGLLWEIPPSTATIAGLRIPIAGGGYLRLLPFGMFCWLLRKVQREGQSLVVYLHPWEIDPNQPRMRGPWLSRFRHYHNLEKTEGRLISLLSRFQFAPIREAIAPIHSIYQKTSKSHGCRVDLVKASVAAS